MIDIDKIIEEVSNLHPYKKSGNRDSYSQYNKGWNDACDILGERIREQLEYERQVVGQSKQFTCSCGAPPAIRLCEGVESCLKCGEKFGEKTVKP